MPVLVSLEAQFEWFVEGAKHRWQHVKGPRKPCNPNHRPWLERGWRDLDAHSSPDPVVQTCDVIERPFFVKDTFTRRCKVDSNGLQPTSDGLQPRSDGLQPRSDGLQPNRDGLQPNSDALQPRSDGLNLIAMASNLIAMASNLRAMATNLIARVSNLMAMASKLIDPNCLQPNSD